ncbi:MULTISPECIES: UDP-galactopyranose mutase [unclassified Olleya]|jgi:UDP-galactopyranose mutase|uniref:UDP-galactopyranose mutase n=1 Tax=unclassified Olleya TaxID=2615019 RepID=UPI0011A1CF63|nr:UDP-galactopyranose mutase [Olleya sp. Hel_I_94]TVZ49709.1 UDP-galactopyranose mutase [Olleya sp. Hel_I_94]|tara:strand:+ start:53190 stop:54329 length:1140 start_codon:yes stop_codon:yes gene_type:complete
MNKNYDYVLVGAGFYCSIIAERIANDLGKKVLIVEKRNHIGGNCFSETNIETGIEFHKYGTHIFHTSNKKVWEYISNFTTFNSYYHQVLITYNSKVYQMPINLETINSFYNINLKPFEVDDFLEQEFKKESYTNPKNFEEQAINIIGRPLYDAFIKGYTIKQWGRDPKDLPASIIKRLPFRKNYSESYFFDTYQGIPTDGFTAIFDKLLASNNIDIQLNTDFFEIKEQLNSSATIIYSGSIDRLLDYRFGELDYRTLDFEFEVVNYEDFQGTSVMNYGNQKIPYTRIHEPKHLHPERTYNLDKTLIIKEYSKEANREEPYYPIGGEVNKSLYAKYLKEVKKVYPNLIIGGRLGDYKYYDMHHVIENALDTYNNLIKKGC